ncbi:MAG TPA: YncE family protein [Candidatus Angelobacter sp.]|jgi:DNA-binding beta-propeller fold protein YncE
MKALKMQRVVIAIFVLLLSALALAADGGYHQIEKYNFPAAQGSTREYFDYITVDSASRRVYLSHGTEIIVIDADTGAIKGAITGLKQDHGVAFAPEFNRGFITDGGDGKVVIFDLKTLKKIGEANADKDADSIVYDPASKRVFAMNGDPHSSTVIDAKTGKVVGTIDLGGGPEFAVADGKGTVYVNIEDKDELVAIDSKSLKIKSRWPLAPAGAPTALAIDLAHRRLFSAGRKPQMLVVLDADSGKIIQSFPISGGVDAAAYDPETGLIFASTREGKIHVFHQDSPDKYSEVETVKTAFGAKTLGLDTRKHTVFVDTADFSQPARSDARPTPIPGTFHVLVYGR